MKTKKIWMLIPTLLFSLSLIAQSGLNIVVNGGFEDAKNKKLRRTRDLDRAEGWVSPTGNTADLYSGDASMPDVMTPENIYGIEEPKEGINYAGVVAYSYREKEDRTYLTSKLNSSMKKGVRYKVEFYASRAELAKYSVNRLGAHFSKRIPGSDEKVPALILETHVEHPKQVVFDGDYGWDKVCGEYVAEGNEKYITIGNFYSDNEVKEVRNRKPRDVRGKQIIAAYYYIDDISVTILGTNQTCDCNYSDEAKQEMSTVYQRSPQITQEMTTAQKVNEYNVYYAGGRYDIRVDGDQTLDKLVEIAEANPNLKIQITGHSDAAEVDDPETADISLNRAEYVRSQLVNKGLSVDQLVIKDMKAEESSPYIKELDDDKTKAAKNRRVSFKVL
jgi:outer membrane protein OmpA-like peptidoglycan-associated protein